MVTCVELTLLEKAATLPCQGLLKHSQVPDGYLAHIQPVSLLGKAPNGIRRTARVSHDPQLAHLLLLPCPSQLLPADLTARPGIAAAGSTPKMRHSFHNLA